MTKETDKKLMSKIITDMLNEKDYDCGYINDYGGGNVDWWMDYIRSEINACNDYWRSVIEQYDQPIDCENCNWNGIPDDEPEDDIDALCRWKW